MVSAAELGLAWLAGSLTTLNPCVFPLLPLVLGGAIQENRLAPVAMGAGMVSAFALLGLLVGVAGDALGLDPDRIRIAGDTAWRAARTAAQAEWVIGLFALNGFLNISWSILFFRFQRPDWAFVEVALLWLSILAMILYCGRFSRTAALLLVPYLAWVSFAGSLNWAVVQLNAPFG